MKEDLVSIIMPSYNTGKFIKETINSVLNQTYNNWELIIVDDCSTDDTEEIVNAIKDNRIKFLKNSTNSGAAISRNKAIKEAKGKWIAFLDSDDLWKSEKLTKQIKFMKENDILCVFHYVPLHSAPAGEKFGRFDGKDEHTTADSDRLVRLPMYYNMEKEDCDKVIEKTQKFFGEMVK